jgi:hypothetical protein
LQQLLAAELAVLQKVMLEQVWLVVQEVVAQVQEGLALARRLLAVQALQGKETLAEINQQIIILLQVEVAQVQQAQMALPMVAQVVQVQHPQLADLQ